MTLHLAAGHLTTLWPFTTRVRATGADPSGLCLGESSLLHSTVAGPGAAGTATDYSTVIVVITWVIAKVST